MRSGRRSPGRPRSSSNRFTPCILGGISFRPPSSLKNNLPPPEREFHAGEFAFVTLVAFGFSIAGSVATLLTNPPAGSESLAFTDAHLWSVVGYELFVAPIIFLTLRQRGWLWSDFHLSITERGTLEGVGLAVVILIPDLILDKVFGSAQISTSLAAVLAVSIVNPLFEELLVCGYVIEALRKRFGLTLAVNVSIAIRLTYHVYQGPQAFITFAIFGLVFTLFYVRTGRLWPLVVAHALLDFIGLATFD